MREQSLEHLLRELHRFGLIRFEESEAPAHSTMSGVRRVACYFYLPPALRKPLEAERKKREAAEKKAAAERRKAECDWRDGYSDYSEEDET